MTRLLLLAYALDAGTTLAGLAAGGVETNPLVAELGPGPYLGACALRAGVAVALARAAGSWRRSARTTIELGLTALVATKLTASASNLAFVLRGVPLVDGAGLVAVAVGVIAVQAARGSPSTASRRTTGSASTRRAPPRRRRSVANQSRADASAASTSVAQARTTTDSVASAA